MGHCRGSSVSCQPRVVSINHVVGRYDQGEGRALAGAALDDQAGTARTMGMIERRYGLMGRILGWLNARRARRAAGGPVQHVGLRVSLTDA